MKKNICVFCGANTGNHSEYRKQAKLLGKTIAEQNRRLIYGGGNKGLMGIIANAVLAHGGEVIGIIPERLIQAETAHHGITCLEVVDNMNQRKARLSELADGFIAMPGGTGTLEEVFEVWTGMQIGYHEKPVALFNPANFWQPLLDLLQHAVNEGFVREGFYNTLIISDDSQYILQQMDDFIPKDLQRWVKK